MIFFLPFDRCCWIGMKKKDKVMSQKSWNFALKPKLGCTLKALKQDPPPYDPAIDPDCLEIIQETKKHEQNHIDLTKDLDIDLGTANTKDRSRFKQMEKHIANFFGFDSVVLDIDYDYDLDRRPYENNFDNGYVEMVIKF